MKKHFFYFLFLISSFLAAAQTYNYIGVEDGLSNRRVYAIQKGPKGYMWFLTHDGIDRYNGKEFKHYKLMDGEDEINSMMNLNWLYSDSQGRLWEIGKQGRVFCYESKHDRFQLVYKLPKSETEGLHTPVSYGFIDDNNIIWLCNQRNIYLYNSLTKATVVIKNENQRKHHRHRADRRDPLFYRHGCRRALCRTEKQCACAKPLRETGYAKTANQRAVFIKAAAKSLSEPFKEVSMYTI